MGGAIKQIEQDLAALEGALVELAKEFNVAYRDYLVALRESMRRQVVLACYHLCTQGYPERFLKLSSSERQALQQAIQNQVTETHSRLITPLKEWQDEEEEDEHPDLPELLSADITTSLSGEVEHLDREAVPDLDEELDDDYDDDDDDFEDELALNFEGEDISKEEQQAISAALRAVLAAERMHTRIQVPDFEESDSEHYPFIPQKVEEQALGGSEAPSPELPRITPELLIVRQEMLEEMITSILRDLAEDVNELLQKAGIIPRQLPDAVVQAALKSEISAEATGGPPNMLNLLVQSESPVGSRITRLMTVRLRPAELEFSDTMLSAQRSRIRELTAKLQKVGKDYFKKKRELAVVEAESAWRSTWYEQEP